MRVFLGGGGQEGTAGLDTKHREMNQRLQRVKIAINTRRNRNLFFWGGEGKQEERERRGDAVQTVNGTVLAKTRVFGKEFREKLGGGGGGKEIRVEATPLRRIRRGRSRNEYLPRSVKSKHWGRPWSSTWKKHDWRRRMTGRRGRSTRRRRRKEEDDEVNGHPIKKLG